MNRPSLIGDVAAAVADGSSPPLLRLLGPPALQFAGRSTPWPAERPYLLLALLACRRDWVGRDELADLLYPGRDLSAARSNLRKVLHLARQVQGAEGLEQQGNLLRWTPDSDLQRFESAIDGARFDIAIDVYGSALLEGTDAGWPAGASAWLTAERGRLETLWHDACARRLAELQDQPQEAAALAARVLRQDPLDEMALESYAQAQAALGRHTLALKTLTDHAGRVQEALDVAPSLRLQALAGTLREALARPAAAVGAATAPGSVPVPTLPRGFVGRRVELGQIAERLADPAWRRLTLLGPGGIGKTTLARAALARSASESAVPGVWVPLGDDDTPDDVARRLAAALHIEPSGDDPPWTVLARALASGLVSSTAGVQRVVALDNAESIVQRHGTALGEALDVLLDAAPSLRLIVTSRAALGGAGEYRLPLDGLPLPDADETDSAVLHHNDAVCLFAARAAACAHAFDLALEAVSVVRLVHAVEGMPLALELLASWRRYMPTADIVAELAASAELLAAPTGPGTGGNPVHRSLEASFNRSWQMLGSAEQSVLAKIAVLPQPLPRAMARQVLAAPLPVLAALVDRSLLRNDDDGRFTLHPLIRRLAAPHAQARPGIEALLERHARDVAHRLGRNGLTHGALLAAVASEIDHARAAWGWAVAQADAAAIALLAGPLASHERTRGSWTEASALLETAAARLRVCRPDGPGRAEASALARVLAGLADLQYARGQLEASGNSAREALTLASAPTDEQARADARMTLCSVAWQLGRLDEALAWISEYADCAQAGHDRLQQAHALTTRGLLLGNLDRHDEALAACQAARLLLHEIGETAFLPTLLNNMGNLLRKMGRQDEALRTLQEGLHWADRHGLEKDRPWLLSNLAIALEDQGAFDQAADRLAEAIDALTEGGEPYLRVFALSAEARLRAARGASPASAMAPLWRALGVASATGLESTRYDVLISAARVWLHAGETGRAAALLHWVGAQASTPPGARAAAARILGQWPLEPGVLEAATRDMPESLSIEAVLATLPGAYEPWLPPARSVPP